MTAYDFSRLDAEGRGSENIRFKLQYGDIAIETVTVKSIYPFYFSRYLIFFYYYYCESSLSRGAICC